MPELICSADDPRWQAERRHGVTATDITAILGLSPYESAYSLYCRKTGEVEDERPDNNRLRLGRELEPIILRRCLAAGIKGALHSGLLYRSTARPWQMATMDAVAEWDEPVELKSWADWDRDAWNTLPPRVRAQVLWQMDTLDVARGHVGVLFLPSGEFRSYVIEHQPIHPGDMRACELGCEACLDLRMMRVAARDFLDRIDRRDPPPVDGSSATLAALRERFPAHKGKEAEIDPDLWSAWNTFKDQADAYEQAGKVIEAKIRVQLGEAGILTVNGVKVATRVIRKVENASWTDDHFRRVKQ